MVQLLFLYVITCKKYDAIGDLDCFGCSLFFSDTSGYKTRYCPERRRDIGLHRYRHEGGFCALSRQDNPLGSMEPTRG